MLVPIAPGKMIVTLTFHFSPDNKIFKYTCAPIDLKSDYFVSWLKLPVIRCKMEPGDDGFLIRES